MSNITFQEEGRRVYVLGDTFPIKNAIKEAGGHWDSDRKAWWIGAAKRPVIEAAIGSAPVPQATAERREEKAGDETEVRGKVKYKGKTYFVIWAGETKKGRACKLTTFDGSCVFWANESEVEWVKTYQAREERSFYGRGSGRSHYPTLGSIRRFIEEKKKVEKGGECPRCADRPGYFGSGDYETCSLCGGTYGINY
jgi:hypothetical protein